jgi:hypothetical protein
MCGLGNSGCNIGGNGGGSNDKDVMLLVLWYLFYRYLCVPPGTTQKSTAQKCNILLSIKIHIFRDPMGVVKYGHIS